MKKIIAFLTALIVILSVTGFASVVSAAEDFKITGSLTIVTEYNKKPLSGIKIEIFRIADAVSKDNNGAIKYEATETFKSIPEILTLDPYKAGENASLVRILRRYIAQNRSSITGITADTDSNGKAVFSDLPAGLYLIGQNKDEATGNNRDYNMTWYVIPVPYVMEDGYNNYIVMAQPKISPVTPEEPTTNPPSTTTPTTEPTTNPQTTSPTEPNSRGTTETPTNPTNPTNPTSPPTQPAITQPKSPEEYDDITHPTPPRGDWWSEYEDETDDEWEFDDETGPKGSMNPKETDEEYEEFDNTIPLIPMPPEPTEPKPNPITGDQLPMIILFALTLSGIIIAIIIKKKQDKKIPD